MILECWQILCELAPWLLLGMLLSGVLHAFLPSNFIRRKFIGLGGVIKAVLLGVPLPLCSCGVVPAGIGLKNQGASDGASVGFLISTPQTGIDSILVSASFFGWPFAIFKMVLAAITGVAGGILTDLPNQNNAVGRKHFLPRELPVTQRETKTNFRVVDQWWQRIWNHGFEILQSVWLWLVIGIVLSAVIKIWLPPSWLARLSELGIFPAMLLMLLVSIPMYVCATASVPIAAALVQGGLHPATAMVFLMAGPASNITTIGAIRSRFGNRTTLIYLATLIVGSMMGAWLFSELVAMSVTAGPIHHHHHTNWFSQVCATLLLLMIFRCTWQDLSRRLNNTKRVQHNSIHSPSSTIIGIDGMHCQSCVGRIEKALNQQPGVMSTVVDLQSKTAIIVGDIELSNLYRAIENAGFKVRHP